MRDLKAAKAKRVKVNRRKQEKQPRDWKKLFHRLLRVTVMTCSGVLVAAGAGLTAKLLLESGYFGVDELEVVQQNRASDTEVIALSDIQMGDSIFDLNLGLIGAKIEENPWIAAARVERVFPQEGCYSGSGTEPSSYYQPRLPLLCGWCR